MQHLGIFTQIPGPKISDKITKKSPIGHKTRAAITRAKNLSKKQQKTDIFSIEDSPDTQPEDIQSETEEEADISSEEDFSDDEISSEDGLTKFANQLQAAHDKWVTEENQKRLTQK